jgi:transaldolase
VTVENRIDVPVDPKIVSELLKKFPDFERSYTEDGMAIEDFDTFGPTVRTLRQFIEAAHELDAQIREIMLPNPDKKL